jgi:hypothetical protein
MYLCEISWGDEEPDWEDSQVGWANVFLFAHHSFRHL